MPAASIQILYDPPAEYEIEMRVKRLKAVDAFMPVLFAEGRQFMVVIDGWAGEGYMSGLHLLDGKLGKENETTYKGKLLPENVEKTISVKVLKGNVLVNCDGHPVINWNGNLTRLSLDWNPPDRKQLFLNAHRTFSISKMVLRPRSGAL
jgi:hypothetical protein